MVGEPFDFLRMLPALVAGTFAAFAFGLWPLWMGQKQWRLEMDFRLLVIGFCLPAFAVAAGAAPFESQWALENRGQRVCRFNGQNCQDGVQGADLKARHAWGKQRDCSVVVAVLDSGVDRRHPDLASNLLPGKNFVGIFAADDPTDDHLHGTHVTGIIAGAGNEAKGVVGLCRQAKVLPVKVANKDGMLMDSDVLEGIAFAVEKKARVVNGSFGGGPTNRLVRDAIANAKDILFVFAAGNGDSSGRGLDIDRAPVFPASYDLANVVAVAATDNRDQLGRFSNFGARRVHLAAPGVSILSTLPMRATAAMTKAAMPPEMGALDGTSMATPYVAGAAAMYWSTQPTARPEQVKARLLASVDKLPSLQGKVQSGGRLNVAKLLGVK